MSLALTGVSVTDPKARILREFRYAQGDASGQVAGRDIVLVANMTSAGTETVETLNAPIQDFNDCFTRFGRRSAMALLYRAVKKVAPQAIVWGVAVAENGAATASSVTFTFTTTADGPSTISVEWGTNILNYLQVVVGSGDTAIAQAAALAAAINANPDVPFTAVQQAPTNDHKVTVTCSNKGPRGDFIVNALRVRYLTPIATGVAKSAITPGAGADDITNALAALARQSIYYHAAECTAVTTVTVADGGVGQYCDYIRTQSSPSNGKDQILCVGVDGTQANGTAVAVSSAANLVRASFYRVHGSDWTPGMVAAHLAGVRWLKRQAYPAASLTGYTNADGTPFLPPDPFNKSNRPTASEMSADLNNGVTPIEFTAQGVARLNRGITSYSLIPGTSTKDYRAREDHIPEVLDAAWEYLQLRWLTTRQDNITGDPPKGGRPLKGFNTPARMRSLVFSVIDVLSSTACPFNNTPILDPEAVDAMRASVYIEERPDGFGVSVDWQAARHDNKDDFLILQGGAAY